MALEQAVAGPFCSRQLADMGADVIKIERPDGGDFARSYDTVIAGQSAYFVWLNRGKRSMVLDLKSPEGLALLTRLVARADVLVHNLAPGAVERLGFGFEAIAGTHPRLVWCNLRLRPGWPLSRQKSLRHARAGRSRCNRNYRYRGCSGEGGSIDG